MVKATWRLLNQPLVDEAVVPSVMVDKSREVRFHAAYIVNHEAMVDDCSAWCLEVKEGRKTFQMVGNPIRYIDWVRMLLNHLLRKDPEFQKAVRRQETSVRRELEIMKNKKKALLFGFIYSSAV